MRDFLFLKFLDRLKKVFSAMGVDYPVMRRILQVKLVMNSRRSATVINQEQSERKNTYLASLATYAFMGVFIGLLILLSSPLLLKMSIVRHDSLPTFDHDDEENNVIMGFIGLIENYIAGIFIDANNQSKGTGKALLDYVKKTHSELSLEVYKNNPRAVKFYLREGLAVSNEKTDENTWRIRA